MRNNQHQQEQDIVQKVIAGDTQAYNQLVARYQFRLQNVVLSYVNDPNEAWDIVQEAFIRAYRALPRFKCHATFYTWLYRIAINCARTYALKEKKHAYHQEIAYETLNHDDHKFYEQCQVYDLDNPELNICSDESLQIINQTIQEMPIDMRTAYTLREIEGLSYSQVAKIMKCPVGTVRSRIYRARIVMDKRLKHSD